MLFLIEIVLLKELVKSPTLSLIVGLSWMKRNRFATTGSEHNIVVSKMVSHTFGWFREFLAVPEKD